MGISIRVFWDRRSDRKPYLYVILTDILQDIDHSFCVTSITMILRGSRLMMGEPFRQIATKLLDRDRANPAVGHD
jgi:hypothetical protein